MLLVLVVSVPQLRLGGAFAANFGQFLAAVLAKV
jgi:hypothetical protein